MIIVLLMSIATTVLLTRLIIVLTSFAESFSDISISQTLGWGIEPNLSFNVNVQFFL